MLKDDDLVKTLSIDAVLARIDFFVSTLSQKKSPATVQTYKNALDVFKLWAIAQEGSLELSQKNLEKFPIYLKTERKVAYRTILTYLTAMRQFFMFLVKEGLLEEDPAKNITIEREIRPAGRGILTEEEIVKLFEVAVGNAPIQLRDRAILCCMLLEGLSEGEIVKCNYEDLEHTLMGKELNIREKDGRRIVPLDGETYRSLRAYLATRRRPILSRHPLFQSLGPRESYGRMKVRTVRSRMRLILDRAMITRPGITPQSLVHTSILFQIQKGVTRSALKERTRPWILYHRLNDLKERGLIDPSY